MNSGIRQRLFEFGHSVKIPLGSHNGCGSNVKSAMLMIDNSVTRTLESPIKRKFDIYSACRVEEGKSICLQADP